MAFLSAPPKRSLRGSRSRGLLKDALQAGHLTDNLSVAFSCTFFRVGFFAGGGGGKKSEGRGATTAFKSAQL